MLFRILTFLLLFSVALFFLAGSQRPVRPAKILVFNDNIVRELIDTRVSAIKSKDSRIWKGLFSKDLVIEFINPDGSYYIEGIREAYGLIDAFSEHGRTYESEILNEAIMISEDKTRALVKRTSRENWLFNSHFDDFCTELSETAEWVLENNVPQIIRLEKSYASMSAFNQQYRDSTFYSSAPLVGS